MITLVRVFSCVNQSFSMFYSTRENGENKWKGERGGGGSRGEPETAERGSSMKSEISME